MIQAEGAMVQFNCEIHLDAIGIKWSIADVYLSQYHPAGVTTHSQGRRSVMNIPARAEFNGSAIKCVAVDVSFSFEVSNTANISVQGSYEFLYNYHNVTKVVTTISTCIPTVLCDTHNNIISACNIVSPPLSLGCYTFCRLLSSRYYYKTWKELLIGN